mmetsp:Transcript_1225/g.4018  ORF Transcript_1225/g.4018 Transcript_1225/m.4018 type:complete len:226 (-) Transcript_1225:229-906(-)
MRGKALCGRGEGEGGVAAHDAAQRAPDDRREPGVLDRLAVERRALGNLSGDLVLARVGPHVLLDRARGEERGGAGEEEEEADAHDGQAHPPDLKEAKFEPLAGRLEDRLLRKREKHEVGRRADERARAADDGAGGERDEKLGWRQPRLDRQVAHSRDEERDDRRVVEEGREDRHRQHKPREQLVQRGGARAAPRDDELAHGLKGTRPLETRRHREEHHHREQPAL